MGFFEEIVRDYKIIADTSAFLDPNSQTFFNHLIPLLQSYNNSLIIPYVTVLELHRLSASEAIGIYSLLESYNLCTVRGESGDTSSEDVLEKILNKFYSTYNLSFIVTQPGLQNRLRAIVKKLPLSKNISIVSISSRGRPQLVFSKKPRCSGKNGSKNSNSNGKSNFNYLWSYLNSIQIDPSPIAIASVPSEGSVVYGSSGNQYILGEYRASGGEGTIYSLEGNSSSVAKIYHSDKLTVELQQKIEVMSQFSMRGGRDFSIAWPREALYSQEGFFVGFKMKKVSGTPLQHTVFIPNYLKDNGYTRRDLVQIAGRVLSAFIAIHSRGFLIGDINPHNILLNEESKKIFIIDTDSFQIGPFRCKVGTPQFTHPLNIDRGYSEYDRTPRDEAFAVFTMLFMILHAGKHPFSHKGGGDIVENIKKRDLPYRLKGKGSSYKKAPVGYWTFMWSHLPLKIKQFLYETLTGEREPFNFQELLQYEEEIFSYLKALEDRINRNKVSDTLFPKYFYIPSNIRKVTFNCKQCGEYVEVAEDIHKRRRKKLCFLCEKTESLNQWHRRHSDESLSEQNEESLSNYYYPAVPNYTYTPSPPSYNNYTTPSPPNYQMNFHNNSYFDSFDSEIWLFILYFVGVIIILVFLLSHC